MSFLRYDLFELLDPDFTKRLHKKYTYCEVDYVHLHLKGDYEGEVSHRAAALHAMEEILKRQTRYFEQFIHHPLYMDHDFRFDDRIDETKLIGAPYSVERFFSQPDQLVFEHLNEYGRPTCWSYPNCDYEQYIYAFCLTPHCPTNPSDEDWRAVNRELFPNREGLEIYSWNDDWQEFYFSNGKEWWGCFYWTVYDPLTKVFTIVAASTTD
ncbi:hypothetical protein [Bartonella sp. HY406]|uniref:hypothetical protein n=1 Tax=Bartonella sp. HY406 TaxID=2979331 RepID=UPI0021C6E8E8|nr:hypothetical protein [Bartonella sp. HY406]UXN02587.1 hypothetical protein N6B01_08865 [Bartonella sp. HY406]